MFDDILEFIFEIFAEPLSDLFNYIFNRIMPERYRYSKLIKVLLFIISIVLAIGILLLLAFGVYWLYDVIRSWF